MVLRLFSLHSKGFCFRKQSNHVSGSLLKMPNPFRPPFQGSPHIDWPCTEVMSALIASTVTETYVQFTQSNQHAENEGAAQCYGMEKHVSLINPLAYKYIHSYLLMLDFESMFDYFIKNKVGCSLLLFALGLKFWMFPNISSQ